MKNKNFNKKLTGRNLLVLIGVALGVQAGVVSYATSSNPEQSSQPQTTTLENQTSNTANSGLNDISKQDINIIISDTDKTNKDILGKDKTNEIQTVDEKKEEKISSEEKDQEKKEEIIEEKNDNKINIEIDNTDNPQDKEFKEKDNNKINEVIKEESYSMADSNYYMNPMNSNMNKIINPEKQMSERPESIRMTISKDNKVPEINKTIIMQRPSYIDKSINKGIDYQDKIEQNEETPGDKKDNFRLFSEQAPVSQKQGFDIINKTPNGLATITTPGQEEPAPSVSLLSKKVDDYGNEIKFGSDLDTEDKKISNSLNFVSDYVSGKLSFNVIPNLQQFEKDAALLAEKIFAKNNVGKDLIGKKYEVLDLNGVEDDVLLQNIKFLVSLCVNKAAKGQEFDLINFFKDQINYKTKDSLKLAVNFEQAAKIFETVLFKLLNEWKQNKFAVFSNENKLFEFLDDFTRKEFDTNPEVGKFVNMFLQDIFSENLVQENEIKENEFKDEKNEIKNDQGVLGYAKNFEFFARCLLCVELLRNYNREIAIYKEIEEVKNLFSKLDTTVFGYEFSGFVANFKGAFNTLIDKIDEQTLNLQTMMGYLNSSNEDLDGNEFAQNGLNDFCDMYAKFMDMDATLFNSFTKDCFNGGLLEQFLGNIDKFNNKVLKEIAKRDISNKFAEEANRSKIEEFQESLEKAKLENENLLNKLSENEKLYQKMSEELKIREKDLENLKTQLADHDDLKKQNLQQQQQIQNFNVERLDLEKMNTVLSKKMKDIENENAEIKGLNSKLKNKYDALSIQFKKSKLEKSEIKPSFSLKNLSIQSKSPAIFVKGTNNLANNRGVAQEILQKKENEIVEKEKQQEIQNMKLKQTVSEQIKKELNESATKLKLIASEFAKCFLSADEFFKEQVNKKDTLFNFNFYYQFFERVLDDFQNGRVLGFSSKVVFDYALGDEKMSSGKSLYEEFENNLLYPQMDVLVDIKNLLAKKFLTTLDFQTLSNNLTKQEGGYSLEFLQEVSKQLQNLNKVTRKNTTELKYTLFRFKELAKDIREKYFDVQKVFEFFNYLAVDICELNKDFFDANLPVPVFFDRIDGLLNNPDCLENVQSKFRKEELLIVSQIIDLFYALRDEFENKIKGNKKEVPVSFMLSVIKGSVAPDCLDFFENDGKSALRFQRYFEACGELVDQLAILNNYKK